MTDKPQNLTDLTRALRIAARRAPTPELQAEWIRAADQLDNVIRLTEVHGDAPTRSDLQAALGLAELSIDDHLTSLTAQINGMQDVGKDTHLLAQSISNDLRQFTEVSSQRFAALESGFQEIGERLSEAEQLHAASAEDRTDLRQRLERMEAQIAELIAYNLGVSEERRRALVHMVEEHERMLKGERERKQNGDG